MAGSIRPGWADLRPDKVNFDPGLLQNATQAVIRLDQWLDAQRQPGGYAGPVVHWWNDCLDYTGPGLDWRYEGITIGYLNLWEITRERRWLDKAKRAGDDLIHGQLPSGNFRNSQFELNPATGGTPHEAACDLALLRLASALQEAGDAAWQPYLDAARRNIEAFYMDRLWSPAASAFQDIAGELAFVPNKAATISEALFALSGLTGEDVWVERYALPTLRVILDYQLKSGPLAGAIYQNSLGSRRIEKFFPFYIARCIPAFLLARSYTNDNQFARAALLAAQFIHRHLYPDGSLPQVIYAPRLLNRYPQWVAASGDILRALELARHADFSWDPNPTLRWLLAGQQADGSIRTAVGFGLVTPGGRRDDPRDTLPVVGWCDKAFRFLTSLYTPDPFKGI